MRGRKSVLQAVCATRILGHVAADAADALRRRIWRIEITVGGYGFSHMRIDDARFDDNALVGNVDFEDAIHAGEADDNPALRRERPTAKTGSRSTCDKR